MASLTLEAQLTSGASAVAALDRFWLNGSGFGVPIVEDTFQGTTHLTTQANIESASLNNTKYIDANNVSINGAASAALPIPTNKCALHYQFTHDVLCIVPSAQFYMYNGIEDTVPASTFDFRAAQGGVSTAWTTISSKTSPLLIQPSLVPSLTHDFYIAISGSPTNMGEKTGKIKFVVTYEIP